MRNLGLTIAAAPPLPNSVTTPAGAAKPALICAGVSPPGYGKLGSKLSSDTYDVVRVILKLTVGKRDSSKTHDRGKSKRYGKPSNATHKIGSDSSLCF